MEKSSRNYSTIAQKRRQAGEGKAGYLGSCFTPECLKPLFILYKPL
jgi:hypothetical protein